MKNDNYLVRTTVRIEKNLLTKLMRLDLPGEPDQSTRIRSAIAAYLEFHPLIGILGEEVKPDTPGFIFAMANEDSHSGRLIKKFIALWLSNGFESWEEMLYRLYLALENDCLSRGMDLNFSPDKNEPRSLYIAIEKAIASNQEVI